MFTVLRSMAFLMCLHNRTLKKILWCVLSLRKNELNFKVFSFNSIIYYAYEFQFGRWSLLTAGILYGAYHQSRLSKKEAINRKIEAEKKVIRDAQLAIEKKKRYEGKPFILIKDMFQFIITHVSFTEEVKAIEELSRPTKKVVA